MKQAVRGFDFRRIMDDKAQLNQFVLDEQQRQVIQSLHALGKTLSAPKKAAKGIFGLGGKKTGGVYIWGKVGRGKSFIVDSFFAAAPVSSKMRVHFHDFLRDLHRQMNAPQAADNTLETALGTLLGDCRLLCFDELHLHDVGDAMLVKGLLAWVISSGTVLVATSNYPPEQLLSHPLYHARFVPSIKLIEKHLEVMALGGTQDYRQLGSNDLTPFCEGVFLCPGNDLQRRECGLPQPGIGRQSLNMGSRTLELLSAPGDFLHFSFEALCVAPTAVMDYLALCDRCDCWIIEGVPKLAGQSGATQQRFINVIDVLYERQCRLYLFSEYGLDEMTRDVEQEDIQRTRSRLSQLKNYV
ncbi:cell division protein ZapE [Rouxiella badensis]|uniref:cell division protein ZapE n=1 Tax=Rouxiella badensis TaxID=1646377 RepID=UPI001B534DE4|nr:cell division protein ZapE [Rouxiella badensis]MCC3747176.1 cell division protein ZapE [Rouxiella badensis]